MAERLWFNKKKPDWYLNNASNGSRPVYPEANTNPDKVPWAIQEKVPCWCGHSSHPAVFNTLAKCVKSLIFSVNHLLVTFDAFKILHFNHVYLGQFFDRPTFDKTNNKEASNLTMPLKAFWNGVLQNAHVRKTRVHSMQKKISGSNKRIPDR